MRCGTSRNLFANHTRFLTVRWSYSTMLFKYLHWRKRQRWRSTPSDFNSVTAGT